MAEHAFATLTEAEDWMWDGVSGNLAFDVGANVGQLVERMLPLFGRVVALEPAFESFAQLAARWGSEPRADCLNVAAGERAGVITLAMLIEFHSAALRDQCEAVLHEAGYEVETVRPPDRPRGSHFWLGYGWLVGRPQ